MAIPKILEHERKLRNIQDGDGSLAVQTAENTASGESAFAEGQSTTASGDYSHAEGIETTAGGWGAHAEGRATAASGDLSHAEGLQTTASGGLSHAEGDSTTASGNYSHAEGLETTASGAYSHAEGNSTTAMGESSHAEGSSTAARGVSAHAEGDSTIAMEWGSHAEGHSTMASCQTSHAEGQGTQTTGWSAHAEGYYTAAKGAYTHAEGYYTTAGSKSQHAQGEYNIIEEVEDKYERGTYAHIVGNGTDSSARSNAHTLDWDGNAWYSGDIYVGSTSGTNKDEGSKKLATEEYVDNSGGTFYAIYGTTTHAEILTAYNQGKTIVAVNNRYIGYLRTPPTEEESISFITMPLSTNYSSENRYWWNVSTSNVWSSGRGYSGGYTFDAPIRLFNNTPINTSNYYRPINVSLNPPTASDGQIGDIWIVYSNE